jgi:hypothetical protein
VLLVANKPFREPEVGRWFRRLTVTDMLVKVRLGSSMLCDGFTFFWVLGLGRRKRGGHIVVSVPEF